MYVAGLGVWHLCVNIQGHEVTRMEVKACGKDYDVGETYGADR